MNRNKIIGIGFLLVILILIAGFLHKMYIEKENSNNADEGNSITTDNFVFSYNYKGDNLWEYTINGTLPNPCYTMKTESIVKESYPEQVTVTSTITEPSADFICTQVIQEIHEVGEFQASEFASVSFQLQ